MRGFKDIQTEKWTDQSASFIVVEVDPGLNVTLATLPGVQEERGELDAEVEVVRAAAPLPAVTGAPSRAWEAAGLAATGQQTTLATGSGHAVSHPRRSDGVREGRLPVTWNITVVCELTVLAWTAGLELLTKMSDGC